MALVAKVVEDYRSISTCIVRKPTGRQKCAIFLEFVCDGDFTVLDIGLLLKLKQFALLNNIDYHRIKI
jgi:hypothetical protein